MKSMLVLLALTAHSAAIAHQGEPAPRPGQESAAGDTQRFEQGSRLLAEHRFDAAIPLLEAAQRDALSRLGPLDPVTLDRTARLVQALEMGGQARLVADVYQRSFDAAVRRDGEARALGTDLAVSLASAYLSLGRIAEAAALAARIRRELERNPSANPVFQAEVHALLAGIFHRLGVGTDAESHYLRAIDIVVRQSAAEQSDKLPGYHQGLGLLYLDLGRVADADLLFERARDAGVPAGYRGAVQRFLLENGSALSTRTKGQVDPARQRFADLLATASNEIGERHPVTLMLQNNLAFTLDMQGRLAEASPLYREVYASRRRALGEGHPHSLTSANNLAWALSRAGDHAGAAALFDEALPVAERAFGSENAITDALLINAILNILAQPQPNLETLERYATALAGAVERGRVSESALVRDIATEPPSESMTSLRSRLLVDALWRLVETGNGATDHYQRAFRAMQLAMAGGSTRAIGEMITRHASATGPPRLRALLAERGRLSQAWRAADDAIAAGIRAQGPAPQSQGEIVVRRQAILSDMQRANEALGREFPSDAAALTGEPISEADAQAMLAPDEALVVILPSDQSTYIYVIRRIGTLGTRSSIPLDVLQGAVDVLRQNLEANAISGGEDYPIEIAHRLYDLLLGLLGPTLSDVRHLYVVASGPLSRLPLGVLVRSRPGGGSAAVPLREVDWLANAFSISQLPSVQSLQLLRRSDRGRNRFGTMIGIGDPVLDADWTSRAPELARNQRLFPQADQAFRERWLRRNQRARALPRLASAATELGEIRRAAGAGDATLLTGVDASEGRLRDLPLEQADLLVFSTHTLFGGEESADGGALVLSVPRSPPPNERDDGFLTAADVLGLRLHADLVILSACNTAGSGLDTESAIHGLMHAFLYAGARSIIASHWSVRDDVAARMTISVIEQLRSDPSLSVPDALRRAQRFIREDADRRGDAHPAIWGAFSFIGDGRRPTPPNLQR
ncbi:MAG TPA: CHAT domain-containing tetratricopeptide repeat protein [Allosphingosinicella sp.]|nr:CHAT domain-containing tetratricopeptide repeat protein [Allosphingosinicella sp.]